MEVRENRPFSLKYRHTVQTHQHRFMWMSSAPGDRRHPAAAATAQAVEQANRFILIHTRLMAQFSTTAHFFRCIGHSLRSREHPCLTHPPRGPAWANGCRGEATEKCAPVTRSRYICQQFCNILVNFKAAPKKHHSNS